MQGAQPHCTCRYCQMIRLTPVPPSSSPVICYEDPPAGQENHDAKPRKKVAAAPVVTMDEQIIWANLANPAAIVEHFSVPKEIVEHWGTYPRELREQFLKEAEEQNQKGQQLYERAMRLAQEAEERAQKVRKMR